MNKKIILFSTLYFFISGCAAITTMNKWQGQFYNLNSALNNRENIIGMTTDQMIEKFGRCHDITTSYSAYGTRENCTYTSTSPVYYGKSMHVMIFNGKVDDVSYY